MLNCGTTFHESVEKHVAIGISWKGGGRVDWEKKTVENGTNFPNMAEKEFRYKIPD